MQFNCRKCNAPIKLDASLLKLSPAQLTLLINKTHDHAHDESNLEILNLLDPKDYVPDDRLQRYEEAAATAKPLHQWNLIQSDDELESESENAGEDSSSVNSNSYVVLTDDESGEVDKEEGRHTISARVKALERIFEVLSQNQDIPHPLSQDCANLLLDSLKLKFDQRQHEKELYLNFLKKLKEREGTGIIEDTDVEERLEMQMKELALLNLEQESKLTELKNLEQQRKALELELSMYRAELDSLHKNELASLLQLKNQLLLDLDNQVNKLEQLKASYKLNLNHLDKLRQLNVYSEIFSISFDSEYSTINGFRLGYKVVWPEINAALGQIVLLLVFLINRLKIQLENYQLVPMGSQSKIIKFSTQGSTRTKSVLNLYTSNEFLLGKLFNFNKLDVVMIALLDIVLQIESQLCQIEEIELPYKISPKKDHIGGKSIRFTLNGEWTQSCMFLLTNLNWILTYTSGLT